MLTELSYKDAQTLMMEINIINGSNEMLNGKIHKFFSNNFGKLKDVLEPFRKSIEVLKKEKGATVVKATTADAKDMLTFENPDIENEYKAEFDRLASKMVKCELMKFEESDLDKFGMPSQYNFSTFYKLMVLQPSMKKV